MEQIFYHETYLLYKKLEKEAKAFPDHQGIERLYRYWHPVFEELKSIAIEIGQLGDGVLLEIPYEEYKLIFIREHTSSKNNVFFINMFRDGSTYYCDDRLFTLKYGDYVEDFTIPVIYNGISYTALNKGSVFVSYMQKHKHIKEMSTLKRDAAFWHSFRSFLDGTNNEDKFYFSIFGSYIIVYAVI